MCLYCHYYPSLFIFPKNLFHVCTINRLDKIIDDPMNFRGEEEERGLIPFYSSRVACDVKLCEKNKRHSGEFIVELRVVVRNTRSGAAFWAR